MKAAALLAPLLLAGCAIPFPDSMYTWEKTGEAYSVVNFVHTTQAIVDSVCPRDFHVMACADRNRETDSCLVFSAYNPMPESVRRHELKHCEGWDHKEG